MAQSPPAATVRERPTSPFLTVWRWHVTMLASILHRASGSALYVGVAGIALWLLALASGPQVFAPVDAALRSPIGIAGLYVLAAAFGYHFFGGLRHLIWDSGRALKPGTASFLAWANIFLALIAPALVWALSSMGAGQ